jgi:hypothetical protein
MKGGLLVLSLLVGCASEPRLVRDPVTGIFRDTVTGQCFVLTGASLQWWTVDVPCRRRP